MIADRIENSARYYGLHPRMEQAFAFIEKCLKEPVAAGRHEIAGDELYAKVFRYPSQEKETLRFETHDRYIDIQCMVSGSETHVYLPRNEMAGPVDCNEKADIAFYAFAGEGSRLQMKEGMFAVYFPEDAHLPGMYDGSQGECVRIVVKIKC